LKYILILLLVGHSPTATVAEFDSKNACDNAAKLLPVKPPSEANPHTIWGYVTCVPKGDPPPLSAAKTP
jgi:hypothetical protein